MKLTDKLLPILNNLNACGGLIEWVGDRTVQEAWDECERGDWMLWLYSRLYPQNKRECVLAASHCANTVRHIMYDDKLTDSVDIAIRYGEGNATDEELKCAAYDAEYSALYSNINADDGDYLNVARAEAAEAAHAIFYDYCGVAEYSAIAIRKKIWDSDGFDCDASYDAEEENQKQTADICRKYLKLEEI